MQQLSSVDYRMLLERFSHWLELQGYAVVTVYQLPRYVAEMMMFMEHRGITRVSGISSIVLTNYLEHLSKRPNHRRGGGLSSSYVCKHIQSLKKFSEYIRRSGIGHLEVRYAPVAVASPRPVVLSELEVRSLYQACEVGTALGQRDRAMLSIYYGCGLRRSEGAALDVSDILMNEQMVYVRKGKNYRERTVPMSGWVIEHLQEYLDHWRGYHQDGGLFISRVGQRSSGGSLYQRLRLLCSEAGIEKAVGLHSLRHSLATHLLHRGMSLDKIRQMLGHRSSESTQLYTHLEMEG